jgi:hypothetical protein
MTCGGAVKDLSLTQLLAVSRLLANEGTNELNLKLLYATELAQSPFRPRALSILRSLRSNS